MDQEQFDEIIRSIVGPGTRRDALRSLLGGALAALGLAAPFAEADAKRKKKKKKKKNNGNRCLTEDSPCTNDGQCCTAQTKLICEVPFGASNGDDLECCRGAGAVCGGFDEDLAPIGPFCCTGSVDRREFECVASAPNTPGVCQLVVEA